MCLIGLYLRELAATLVVEVQHQGRVGGKAFGSGYLIDIIALPETSRITESTNTTFGRNTCSGKYN